MPVLPNFLMVGVARCGTTSLFHYLNQHPEIGFPRKKEPKYFSSLHITFPQKGVGDKTVDEKMVKSFDQYCELFKELDRFPLIGEASSDYFYYHKETIPEIKKTLGDIPIIISIRNPIERSYSAYNNLVRDDREKNSFKEALEVESQRISENWDWMWAYTRGSLYEEGLKAFMENFSKVKVVIFEELQENPAAVLREIENFLGIDHFTDYDTSVRYSPSGSPKNKFIGLISSRNSGIINSFRSAVMSVIPRKYLEKVAAGFFSKDKIDSKVLANLKKKFSHDIDQTEKLLGRPLKYWQTKL